MAEKVERKAKSKRPATKSAARKGTSKPRATKSGASKRKSKSTPRAVEPSATKRARKSGATRSAASKRTGERPATKSAARKGTRKPRATKSGASKRKSKSTPRAVEPSATKRARKSGATRSAASKRTGERPATKSAARKGTRKPRAAKPVAARRRAKQAESVPPRATTAFAARSAPAGPAERHAAVDPSPFGVNSHVAGSDIVLTLAGAGLRWHRIDIDWNEIEPERGVYAWEHVDRLVDLAERHGLQLFGSIAYTPSWASGGRSRVAPPLDGEHYVAFVRTVARRYRGRPLVALGLWNEPNLKQFYDGTLDFYVNALVVPGLRALAEEAPEVLRCGPDLSSSRDVDKWLGAVLRAGGTWLDVITHHQYDGKDRVKERVAAIEDLHKKLEREGFGDRPLWISETGWDVPKKATPETQAEHLRGLMAAMLARRAWWHKTFWYDSHGPTWGLLGADGTPERGRPTPAFHAYRDVIARAGDAPRPQPGPGPQPRLTLEQARLIVEFAYRAILGRAGDDGDPGREAYARELERGLSLLEFCRALFTSAEFVQGRGQMTHEALADELYVHVLGRSADPEGHASTVAALRAGRAAEHTAAMFASEEFQQRLRHG